MATFNTNFQVSAERRPCWADGRRAIFHRWTDSARPVKPRGMEDEETTDRFQLHSVHALVEYEDGTMERVWPNTIQFADSEQLFAGYDWEAAESTTPTRSCDTCAHVLKGIGEEPCDGCFRYNKWEPAGGSAHGNS